ncbi:MAG: glycosyltransferase family 2 protein [Clostridiaceae bacterium]
MKILAVIPAYNEEKSIAAVIQDIRHFNPDIDILVIDDGSMDNTYKEAKSAGAKVISLPRNLGIGGAVQTGYKYANGRDYDVVIQVDGDGQHDPKDLMKLVSLIKSNEADLVIGSRFLKETEYESSFMRQLGINFFSKLVSILCGTKYYDTTSGYRAANKAAIALFSSYYPKDYPEVETIVYAIKKGLTVKEVSVDMNQRQGGKSSITPLKSIYYMIKVTLALIFRA